MMGRRRRDQGKLFYEFRLDDRIPQNHLLRRIDVFVTAALADLHRELLGCGPVGCLASVHPDVGVGGRVHGFEHLAREGLRAKRVGGRRGDGFVGGTQGERSGN